MIKITLLALLCLIVTDSFSQYNQKSVLLQSAHWEHTKKKAALIFENDTFIEMEFLRKVTLVKFNDENFEISKKGFWCPQIQIKKGGRLVASSKKVGLGDSKKVFEIDGEKYSAKTRHRRHSSITYSYENNEFLTYKVDASRRKLLITFEIKATDIPDQHLYLLLAYGFYSIRNLSDDSGAAILIVVIRANNADFNV